MYSVNLYTALALKYTRVFNFSTVLTDKDGGKSIHPKFHFVGDFTGDGKMKVLSVSNNHPFGWTDKQIGRASCSEGGYSSMASTVCTYTFIGRLKSGKC